MDTLNINIKNIKNIKNANIELPLEGGVYSLVGANGSGKSTLLLIIAQLISFHYLETLKEEDSQSDSEVTYSFFDKEVKWDKKNNSKNNKIWSADKTPLKINGFYEGSLFYGTRFNDSTSIDNYLKKGTLQKDEIVPADKYVIEQLSFILHGNYDHYKTLHRVKNKHITEKLSLKNTPYFIKVRNSFISQYRMSSGECLLVSLLHFIYNSIVRKSLPSNQKILVLIDEIELALHHKAVTRLLDLLKELTKNHSHLVVFLTSHSPEVIKNISPTNLFRVSNLNGSLTVESNCYPSYLIRDVHSHDGFDFLFLTEDILTKHIVKKILLKNNNLNTGKLIHVVPVGGWNNVLSLHKELLIGNVLGIGKKIISILDGDIINEVKEEYSNIQKIFLPIKSIEKYLYKVLIEQPDRKIIRVLNDKYFHIKSIETLIGEFKIEFSNKGKTGLDKKLYFRIKKDLESRNISEEYFITNFCDDLLDNVDFSKFIQSIQKILN